jgi:hypothetical protein
MFSPLSQYLWVNNPFTDYQFTKKDGTGGIARASFFINNG